MSKMSEVEIEDPAEIVEIGQEIQALPLDLTMILRLGGRSSLRLLSVAGLQGLFTFCQRGQEGPSIRFVNLSRAESCWRRYSSLTYELLGETVLQPK